MLSTSWKKKWESSKCEITWNFISHAIHEVLPSNVAQYCVSPLKCCSAHFYFPWNFYPISLASAKWQLIYYQPLKNQNELETWMEQERRILERKRILFMCSHMKNVKKKKKEKREEWSQKAEGMELCWTYI